MTTAIVGFLAFWAGLSFNTWPHEVGHILTGWALGLQPRRVQFGSTPFVARLRVGRLWILVGANPQRGLTVICPWSRQRPLRFSLFILGGAAGNAACFGLLVLLAIRFPDAGGILVPLGLGQAYGVVNLVPFRTKAAGASDGLQLYHIVRGRVPDGFTAHFEQMMRTVLPDGAALPVPSRDAPEMVYQDASRSRPEMPYGRKECVRVYRELVAGDRLSTSERAFALDLLVSSALCEAAYPASLEELDLWSQTLLALSPLPGMQVSRGGVLVELGRPAEAADVLRPVLDAAMSGAAQAACRLFLAEALHMLGDEAGALTLRNAADTALAAGDAAMRDVLRTRWQRRIGHPADISRTG